MIESDIYAVLIADSGVTALVADRVAAGIIPEGDLRPYVTYSLVTGQRIGSLHDNGVMRHARIQIDCWSPSYGVVKQIALAVQTAIEASALFEAVFLGDIDMYEPDTKMFSVKLDYSFWQYAE